ncbi:claudin-34-like [Notamacropus eugenii]|uniref:claudin-34-like n=1 Tax=Notamacropus eugenii TaxID=9315 RepID=UPI003B684F89
MSGYFTCRHLQFPFFTLATLGWILALVSMGHSEWRVWHLKNTTPVISSGIAWVGICKACFRSTTLLLPEERSDKICQSYGMRNTFLPKDFRAVQIICACACILGAIGTVYSSTGLRNFYKGVPHKPVMCNPFTMAGLFFLSAGTCVSICVIWNFLSVFHNGSINFPDSFFLPPSPKTQEIGNAAYVATVSAILMLLSGVFFFACKFRMNSQVHPMIKGDEESASAPDL